MTKKRIVLLTDCLADLAGGAEKQIVELAKGLDKSAYAVHVVSLDTWGQAPREIIESTGSQLHIFKVVRIYGLSGLIQGLHFKQFLKDNHVDVLVTYHFSSDIWGTFWGHLAGVKKIISNRRDMGFWRNGLHIAAYKLVNRWVNKIIVVSTSIKEMVINKERYDSSCIDVIYNGVQLPEKYSQDSNELRAQLGIKSSDIVIMHVANLKPIKGHKYLLEAFTEVVLDSHAVKRLPCGVRGNDKLSGNDKEVKLVLIGRDELDGQLQNMAQELNILDKVLFLGKRDDIQTLLNAADICVLPSLSEGMSNAILEYMAAGKPVVATKVGGNPELIKDGVNGFLVDKENAQQLKDALIILINDQEKRLNMGQAGYERVKEQFSMPAMIARYEHLFSGIKVLHLVSSGGLFGAERMILNLASKNVGIIPFIGAINNAHNPHLEIIEEAKQLDLNSVVFHSKGKIDLSTMNQVRKFIINNKIDIIHTHNYKSDLIGLGAAKLTGIKWIATHHGWTGADQKLAFYEKMDAFILKNAHKVICVTDTTKQIFLNQNLKKERLEVIDNGIPVDKFNRPINTNELRSSLGINQNDLIIAIVGRLSKEKGYDIFLKAASEVVKTHKNVKFIIVGEGSLRKELEQQAHDLNLDNVVIFTGVRKDMPAMYTVCDILINASYTEGLSMTILEAMASRLPIIATRVGATGKAIKNQENGILLEAGDDKALTHAILELIQDNEKRKLFAERAYKDVCERFSDTRMAERYQEIYSSILRCNS